MDSNSIEPRQKEDGGVMEVPEIDGDLLVELLDASLAGEGAGGQQLGFAADVVVDGDRWIDSQGLELDCAIHAHQDCEDCCGLDGVLLPDFEEYGSPRPRSPAPYAVFLGDGGDTLEWAETADHDDAMGPFTGGCMGDSYMDGMVMAMEWEEEGEGAFSFEPCYGGEVYGSSLWHLINS